MALFFRRISALRSGERAASGLYRIMLLMGLYLVVCRLIRSGGAVMASELMSSRGYRPTEVGAIMGSMFLASAVVQLPAGGSLRPARPAGNAERHDLIAVIGLILFAFAASVPGLTLGRSLIGLGHGTVIAGIYLLAVAWVPVDRVATVTGHGHRHGRGLGALLSTTPLALTLGQFGFTPTFAILAILTLAFSAAIFLMVRDHPDARDRRHPRTVESIRQSLRGLWEVASDRNLAAHLYYGQLFYRALSHHRRALGRPLSARRVRPRQYPVELRAVGYDARAISWLHGIRSHGPYLQFPQVGRTRRRCRDAVVSAAAGARAGITIDRGRTSAGRVRVLLALLRHSRRPLPRFRTGESGRPCHRLYQPDGPGQCILLQAVAGVLVEGVTGTGAEATANGYRSVFAMVAVVSDRDWIRLHAGTRRARAGAGEA